MVELDWIPCPLCAERVPAQNVKCVHCGSTMKCAGVGTGGPLAEGLTPTPGVGPVAIFVVIGLFLGYAAGAALGGWRHSLVALLGGGLGYAVYLLLDGPLAFVRGSRSAPDSTPDSSPKPVSDVDPDPTPDPAPDATPDEPQGEPASED